MDEETDNGRQPAENVRKTAVDDQTGKSFVIEHERRPDRIMARVSALYLICAVVFLLWLLFDTWSGRNLLLVRMGYTKDVLASRSFRLMAFVAIGGALGGALNGIRSIVSWHSERRAYGRNFIWKDISLPPVGAALGVIVYATVKGTAGVLNGDFSLDQNSATPAVTAFAIASLAGFSSWQVFRWLDAQANRLFSVTKGTQTVVPDLSGQTIAEVKAALKTSRLTLGRTSEEKAQSANLGKVMKQSPRPGSVVTNGTPIDITCGGKDA